MRVAALDLGTNTFLLLVAEVENGEIQNVLHDEVRVIRLGQGVNETRKFQPEALQRADQAFQDYSKVIARLKPERVLACATSAARDVSNKQDLLDIASRAGIPLEIISGEREAELTFSGTISTHLASSSQPQIVIDIGGGSTEFILGDEHGIRFRQSVDIGAVRLTEALVTAHPIPENEMTKLRERIKRELLDIGRGLLRNFSRENETNLHETKNPAGEIAKFHPKVIAVAGTPTTLAALDLQESFNAEKIDGYILKREEIHGWVERLSRMSVEQRCALAGMEPKRADVIVAGSMILAAACEVLGVSSLEVSIRGLRYGIAKSLS